MVLNSSIVPVFWSLFEVSLQNISPFSNRIKPKIFETLSDATESNAQRNKLSLQATTSSGISHFRKTHLKRREVVMFRSSSLVCTGWGTYPGACFGSAFQEQSSLCVLVGVLTRERVSGACFRSKLLCVYWLEYLPESVFRERVSGASFFVCTGWGTYPRACFGSVFQEQASLCVLVGVLTRERVSGACFRSKLPRVYRPLKESMKLHWNFQRIVGLKLENSLLEGYGYFLEQHIIKPVYRTVSFIWFLYFPGQVARYAG